MTDKMDLSSPESSGENITTPKDHLTAPASVLSPPDSQQRNMPTSASGSSLANSNGKRPIQTISNGNDDVEEIASMGNGGVSLNGGFPANYATTKTHSSGYTWTAEMDEPGYSWTCKRAQDEYKRATDQMVHKDAVVRSTYGDIFEVVENEKAVLASMKQR